MAFALVIDIAEILGLTSMSRKIPRMAGAVYILPSIVLMVLCAFAFVMMGFDGYSGSSEARRAAKHPWSDYVLILILVVWLVLEYFCPFLIFISRGCVRWRRDDGRWPDVTYDFGFVEMSLLMMCGEIQAAAFLLPDFVVCGLLCLEEEVIDWACGYCDQ